MSEHKALEIAYAALSREVAWLDDQLIDATPERDAMRVLSEKMGSLYDRGEQ